MAIRGLFPVLVVISIDPTGGAGRCKLPKEQQCLVLHVHCPQTTVILQDMILRRGLRASLEDRHHVSPLISIKVKRNLNHLFCGLELSSLCRGFCSSWKNYDKATPVVRSPASAENYTFPYPAVDRLKEFRLNVA